MILLQPGIMRGVAKKQANAPHWAFLGGLLIVAFLAGTPPSLFAETTDVIIATGNPAGAYYPTGTTIAKLVNQKDHIHHVHATAEATAGSVFNINALMTGVRVKF